MTSINDFSHKSSSMATHHVENRNNEWFFTQHSKDYPMTNETETGNNAGIRHDILKGIMETNEISCFFFSDKNINHLQKTIIKQVYLLSNKSYRIGPQSEKELLTIMRSIYLQHCKNQTENIDRQVAQLNFLVLDFAIPRVMNGIQSYLGYVRDHGSNPTPHLEHPQNVNVTGTKTNNNYDMWFI